MTLPIRAFTVLLLLALTLVIPGCNTSNPTSPGEQLTGKGLGWDTQDPIEHSGNYEQEVIFFLAKMPADKITLNKDGTDLKMTLQAWYDNHYAFMTEQFNTSIDYLVNSTENFKNSRGVYPNILTNKPKDETKLKIDLRCVFPPFEQYYSYMNKSAFLNYLGEINLLKRRVYTGEIPQLVKYMKSTYKE